MAIAEKAFKGMKAYQASTPEGGGDKSGLLKTDADFLNALGDALGDDDPDAQSVMSDSARIFHPSTRGHQKIEEVLMKALNDNGIPGDKKDGPKKAPYKTGRCSLHAAEWKKYGTDDGDQPYDLEMWVKDSDGTDIGYKERTLCGPRDPFVVTSKLPESVKAVCQEWDSERVEFTYGESISERFSAFLDRSKTSAIV